MPFDTWWQRLKPAEVDELQAHFEDCWAQATAEAKAPIPRADPAEFEVVADGESYASTFGPRKEALQEARHYALMYTHDGDSAVVEVFEVTRTKVAPDES